jgi:hypothetical protein
MMNDEYSAAFLDRTSHLVQIALVNVHHYSLSSVSRNRYHILIKFSRPFIYQKGDQNS